MKNDQVLKNFLIVIILLVLIVSSIIVPACFNECKHYKIKSVNHRGYYTAPENTISAFRKSKDMGFNIVECDVRFTSDSCPVLIHDDDIERTSDGTGEVSQLTLEKIKHFDFGSWKGEEFVDERIPTFNEFISLCSELELGAYIELKSVLTAEQATILDDLVKKHNMENNVSWISKSFDSLSNMLDIDSEYRVGIVVKEITEKLVDEVREFQKNYENVFIDCSYEYLNDKCISLCKKQKINLEVWTVNDKIAIENMDRYISGVTSDIYIAEDVVNDFERQRQFT